MNDPFQELFSDDDDDLMEDLNPTNARMKGNHDNEPSSRFLDEVVHDDLEYEVRISADEELTPLHRSMIHVNLARDRLKTASGANKSPDALREATVTLCPGVGDEPPAILEENKDIFSDSEAAHLLLRLREEASMTINRPRYLGPSNPGFEPKLRASFLAPQQLAAPSDDRSAIFGTRSGVILERNEVLPVDLEEGEVFPE